MAFEQGQTNHFLRNANLPRSALVLPLSSSMLSLVLSPLSSPSIMFIQCSNPHKSHKTNKWAESQSMQQVAAVCCAVAKPPPHMAPKQKAKAQGSESAKRAKNAHPCRDATHVPSPTTKYANLQNIHAWARSFGFVLRGSNREQEES